MMTSPAPGLIRAAVTGERMRCFLINPLRAGPWSFQPQFADWFRETIVIPALADSFDIREPDDFLNHRVANRDEEFAEAIRQATIVVADLSDYWLDLHSLLGVAVAQQTPVIATLAADVTFPFDTAPEGLVRYGRYELDDVPVAIEALRQAVTAELAMPRRGVAAWVNDLVALQRSEQAKVQPFALDWGDTYWSMRRD